MGNPIDAVFARDVRLKIMTHVVAGFPDMETCRRLIYLMDDCAVDFIEIQIPFSDPIADGSTIMAANQCALDNGVTPEDCFELVRGLEGRVRVPLLFMSYVNVPYRIGMRAFMERSAAVGVSGLIIPDVPFDDDDTGYYESARRCGLYAVPVVSPDVRRDRLARIVASAQGFIYMTLRVGITGAKDRIDERGLSYIDVIKDVTSMPVAAGFGISSPLHLNRLKGRADAAVIGSHVINLLRYGGFGEVEAFLLACKKVTRERELPDGNRTETG